jgi:hypothetical protein
MDPSGRADETGEEQCEVTDVGADIEDGHSWPQLALHQLGFGLAPDAPAAQAGSEAPVAGRNAKQMPIGLDDIAEAPLEKKLDGGLPLPQARDRDHASKRASDPVPRGFAFAIAHQPVMNIPASTTRI